MTIIRAFCAFSVVFVLHEVTCDTGAAFAPVGVSFLVEVFFDPLTPFIAPSFLQVPSSHAGFALSSEEVEVSISVGHHCGASFDLRPADLLSFRSSEYRVSKLTFRAVSICVVFMAFFNSGNTGRSVISLGNHIWSGTCLASFISISVLFNAGRMGVEVSAYLGSLLA